jgi:hypothetical protein
VGVLDESEPELADEELERLVVLADYQRDET